MAATGRVMAQANAIGRISFQLASLLKSPIPKTAPINICVEDTGIPSLVANKITILADSSAEKPVEGKISAKRDPTV